MSSPHPLAAEMRAITGRDLAWLCACLILVIGPHMLRAPLWLTLFALCLVGWRAHITLISGRLPSRWLLIAVAIAGMLGVWIEYRTIFGRSPGLALLMLLSALKLLEMRNHRDATVALLLCYFLILTNFFFTQSIPTAVVMFAALMVITGALVSLSAPHRTALANLRSGALLLAHALPIGAVLFLLFPRTYGPLWGLPQDAYSGVTGLSDAMSPGNLSQLSQSDAIAFRALFKGSAPLPRQLYWRGPVLWDFDGRTWRAGAPRMRSLGELSGGEGRFEYEVVLEPHNRNWLFALETAASTPNNAWMSVDEQVLSLSPVRNRARYPMISIVGAHRVGPESGASLERALRLPPGYNPRAMALAAQWRRTIAEDSALVVRAIAWFREQRFVYTLLPPLLGRDSVDEFLFETRSGFCEHFASAYVFLMRAAGLPARIVTGYLGGDLNPTDGYLTVRQAEAHAWAEVYLQGRGWLRIDPTAASVPGRLEAGLSGAMRGDEPVPFLLRPEQAWLKSLRYNWEALANKWNLWVLSYNSERQREFMSSLGMSRSDWKQLASVLFGSVGAIVLALLAWSLKRFTRPDPVQQAWLAFCRKLSSAGVVRAANEGPRDFTARAGQELPASGTLIDAVGERYIALRYGPRRDPAKLAEFKRLVQEFRPT